MAAAVILIPEMLSGPGSESSQKAAQGGEGAIKTYTIDLSQSPGVSEPATTSGQGLAEQKSAAQESDTRAPAPEATTASPSVPEPTRTDQGASEQFVAEPQTAPEQSPPAAETPADRALPSVRNEEPPAVAESTSPAPRAEPPPRQIAAQPARAEAPPQSSSQQTRTKPEQLAPARAETPAKEKPESAPRPVASSATAPTSSVPAAIGPGKAVPGSKVIPGNKAIQGKKGWAVQLGSYSSEATAERLMNEWRAKGQNAFVMPVNSGGKTLYRVRIGPTKDRAEAEAALKAVTASIPGAAVVAHP
jgi:DedD protein